MNLHFYTGLLFKYLKNKAEFDNPNTLTLAVHQLLSPESVRDACATKLLQAWLRIFDGNVLDLLRCLDVENSTDDTAELTLKVVFNKVPPAELVDNFDLLNEK